MLVSLDIWECHEENESRLQQEVFGSAIKFKIPCQRTEM
jgi:hypothetical protein